MTEPLLFDNIEPTDGYSSDSLSDVDFNSAESEHHKRRDTRAATTVTLVTIEDAIEHVELMYDRLIMRNLSGCGLTYLCDDQLREEFELYGTLDPNAQVESTGMSILLTLLTHVTEHKSKQDRYVHLLIIEGADINEPDPTGRTALMLALQYGWDKPARKLMQENSLKLEATDPEGNTVLHYAARYASTRILRAMIRRVREKQHDLKRSLKKRPYGYTVSTDPYKMTNKDGLTPAKLAEQHNRPEAAQMLKGAQERRNSEVPKQTRSFEDSSDNETSAVDDTTALLRSLSMGDVMLHDDMDDKAQRRVKARRLMMDKMKAVAEQEQE